MIREIEKKVSTYIREKGLIVPGNTLVVGVSGGADSMMLIDYLYTHQKQYGVALKVAHVHHGLRMESDEEEAYVEKWCQARDLPYFVHHCQIKELARTKKISEEEAGRIERYHFFISLTNEGDKIVVAHHMNDHVETMLMHYLRGADIKGLGGIRAERDNIIRPLLCLRRQEIEAYCEAKGIQYYNDHTNTMPIYTRNKMRLECVPYIAQAINPNIYETLFRQGELYQEASDFIEDYIAGIWNKYVCVKKDSISLKERVFEEKIYIQKKLIYNSLVYLANSAKDIGQIHVQSCLALLQLQVGKEVSLPYQLVAKRQYGELVIGKRKVDKITNYEYTLDMGINRIEALNLQIELTVCNFKTFEESKENSYTKYMDYDKIKDSLHLRTRRPGDQITLQSGRKKLKKLLIDDKIPQDERDTLPLVALGNEILWLVGHRMNSNYFVSPTTKVVLKMKITKQDAQEGLC